MTIEKKYLEIFYATLAGNDKLTLVDARIRDKVTKQLVTLVQDYNNARTKIFETYCVKKEDGTPDIENGTQYKFMPAIIEDLNKELTTLLEEIEEIKIDYPAKIKQFIEDTGYTPKVNESEAIDELLAKL